MADIKKLVDTIVELTNKETLELLKELESRGFKAPEPQQIATPIVKEVKSEDIKTSFDVTMESFSSNTKQKMDTIKVYKNMVTGISLMEAKAVIEGCPLKIATAVSKEEADNLKKQFEELGAKITIN